MSVKFSSLKERRNQRKSQNKSESPHDVIQEAQQFLESFDQANAPLLQKHGIKASTPVVNDIAKIINLPESFSK